MSKKNNYRVVALNGIFMDMYSQKNNINIKNIDTADSDFKNFAKDNTKKVKAIFKAIEFDIDQFKDERDRYKIPFVIAEVIKVYLNEKSGKGTFISKLKSEKFDDISYAEKLEFIDTIEDTLATKCADCLKTENGYNELELLVMKWKSRAEFNDEVKEKIEITKKNISSLIKYQMEKVSSIDKFDGVISVEKPLTENELKAIFNYSKINRTDIPYRLMLTYEDRIELLDYLNIIIEDSINQWRRIVDIACEIREIDVEESGELSSIRMNSKQLLDRSISEFAKETNMKMKPHDIQNNDDIEEILKDIRRELDIRNK